MTSIKICGLLGLLVGLALVLTVTTSPGHGGQHKHNLDELSVYDGKKFFGQVIRDGDRFVAIRALVGEKKLGYLHNFQQSGDMLKVDDKCLSYDLSGKNKNVMVRKRKGKDIRDRLWEFVFGEKETDFKGYFRAKNGELKGWWIGLGPVEPAKKEGKRPQDQYKRAPLILVKDKKDAAGFSWSDDPPDDGK